MKMIIFRPEASMVHLSAKLCAYESHRNEIPG